MHNMEKWHFVCAHFLYLTCCLRRVRIILVSLPPPSANKKKGRKIKSVFKHTHSKPRPAEQAAPLLLIILRLCLYLYLYLYLCLCIFLAYFFLSPLLIFSAIHSDSAMLFRRLLPKCVFLFLQKLPKRSAYITL